jgi:hypothetical protein
MDKMRAALVFSFLPTRFPRVFLKSAVQTPHGFPRSFSALLRAGIAVAFPVPHLL